LFKHFAKPEVASTSFASMTRQQNAGICSSTQRRSGSVDEAGENKEVFENDSHLNNNICCSMTTDSESEDLRSTSEASTAEFHDIFTHDGKAQAFDEERATRSPTSTRAGTFSFSSTDTGVSSEDLGLEEFHDTFACNGKIQTSDEERARCSPASTRAGTLSFSNTDVAASSKEFGFEDWEAGNFTCATPALNLSGNGAAGSMGNGMWPYADYMPTFALPLSSDMLSLLTSRRGRQRFRNLRRGNHCYIYLDEKASVLYVSGVLSQAVRIKEELELLEGILVSVSDPVWAELLRCRNDETEEEYSVTNLQKKASCRIHVDRLVPMVRIFGLEKNVAKVQAALHEMDAACSTATIDSSELQENVDIQEVKECVPLVTAGLVEGRIQLLGKSHAVAEAAKAIRVKFSLPGAVPERSSAKLSPRHVTCMDKRKPPGLAEPSCHKQEVSRMTLYEGLVCSVNIGDNDKSNELHYW